VWPLVLYVGCLVTFGALVGTGLGVGLDVVGAVVFGTGLLLGAFVGEGVPLSVGDVVAGGKHAAGATPGTQSPQFNPENGEAVAHQNFP
jgi:hypothetical protein